MKSGTLIALAFLILLPACSSPGGGDTGNPLSRSETLYEKGIRHLSAGEYEEARTSFNELLTLDDPDYTCRAQYGVVLAGVQDTAARLDEIADAAALVAGGAPPPMRTHAAVDVVPIAKNLLKPFESFFTEILGALDQVVASGCSITLPEGMPIEIGNPKSLIYFKARFGYEFDAAAARAGQMIFSSALAGIRFALAHDLEIDLNTLADTFKTLTDAAQGTLAMEVNGPGDVSQHTMIYALRSLGAIPASQDKLLTLGDAERFKQVDNDLAKALRAFYERKGSVETGLLPELVARAKKDADPTDNFLGFVDADASGDVSAGDSIVIGLRELYVAGVLAEPSVDSGVWLTFNRGIGDVKQIVLSVHDIAQVLGDQLASVDDKSVKSRHLGFHEVNDLIANVPLLDAVLTPIPEAAEFDFGAYFKHPAGLRELFPYWVDHDGDAGTPAEFLIEGESWVTSPTEPYVVYGDAGHFAGSYSFKKTTTSAATALTGVAIAADGVAPEKLSVLVPFPLPYLAYQDPTFNGILYVDESKLYGAPAGAPAGMAAATNFTANMATASYFSFVMNEWNYGR
jgi:hypothetical protein